MLNRHRLLRLACTAFVMTLTACDRKPPREFKMEELAGTWRLQPESFASLQARMGREPKDSQLILAADGGFTASEMPLEDFPPIKQYRLRSGKGDWTLSRHSPGDLVVKFDDKDNETLSVEYGENGALVLVHAIGDPESSERWVWKRAR